MKSFISRLFRDLLLIAAIGFVILVFWNWLVVPLVTGTIALSWKICFSVSTILTAWVNFKYPYLIEGYKIWRLIIWAGVIVLLCLILK